jgi:hypothetical protein
MRKKQPTSRVFSREERDGFAWACSIAARHFAARLETATKRGEQSAADRCQEGIVRATRLLERVQPTARDCTVCHQRKPIGEFYLRTRGHQREAQCRSCRTWRAKVYACTGKRAAIQETQEATTDAPLFT